MRIHQGRRQQVEAEGLSSSFRRASAKTAELVGSPLAFLVAVGAVAVWALLGPHFHYSDTWQLVINTGTTIITFLMVFLIQNTQNRDARAIHLKLDELIRAIREADNRVIDAENLSERELLKLLKNYERLRLEYDRRASGTSDRRKA